MTEESVRISKGVEKEYMPNILSVEGYSITFVASKMGVKRKEVGENIVDVCTLYKMDECRYAFLVNTVMCSVGIVKTYFYVGYLSDIYSHAAEYKDVLDEIINGAKSEGERHE